MGRYLSLCVGVYVRRCRRARGAEASGQRRRRAHRGKHRRRRRVDTHTLSRLLLEHEHGVCGRSGEELRGLRLRVRPREVRGRQRRLLRRGLLLLLLLVEAAQGAEVTAAGAVAAAREVRV